MKVLNSPKVLSIVALLVLLGLSPLLITKPRVVDIPRVEDRIKVEPKPKPSATVVMDTCPAPEDLPDIVKFRELIKTDGFWNFKFIQQDGSPGSLIVRALTEGSERFLELGFVYGSPTELRYSYQRFSPTNIDPGSKYYERYIQTEEMNNVIQAGTKRGSSYDKNGFERNIRCPAPVPMKK